MGQRLRPDQYLSFILSASVILNAFSAKQNEHSLQNT